MFLFILFVAAGFIWDILDNHGMYEWSTWVGLVGCGAYIYFSSSSYENSYLYFGSYSLILLGMTGRSYSEMRGRRDLKDFKQDDRSML